MGVMFSGHEDSVWSMLPPRTFSVGFEEQIVVGVMFFTLTDPKIVVKSLFPILYFRLNQNVTYHRNVFYRLKNEKTTIPDTNEPTNHIQSFWS